MPRDEQKIDITIIVTAHAEGLLAHKTLLSVQRACQYAADKGYSSEILVSADKLDNPTLDYFKRNPLNVQIITHELGDLALSRNRAVKHSHGEFIACIDADDLMSRNWLGDSLEHLKSLSKPASQIAHSEHTLVFDGELALVKKYPSQSTAEDALLSVFSNRWTSVIIAHRSIFEQYPYQPNVDGYGYEDWLLNCQTVAAGITHSLIPKTCIFVRRKLEGSLLQSQYHNKALLRANPLLSFKHIRRLKLPSGWVAEDYRDRSKNNIATAAVDLTKKALDRYPTVKLSARKAYRGGQRIKQRLAQQQRTATAIEAGGLLPGWLLSEWRELQSIDKTLFPSDQELARLTYYDSISDAHIRSGMCYKILIDACSYDAYDYIIFVPWLVRGGGDLVAVRYANTIRELEPNWKIAVVGTENHASPFQDQLHENVDFINFGSIANSLDYQEKQKVLEQFIENSGAKKFHIINSLLAYEWFAQRKKYVVAQGHQLMVTSFSQSRDPDGFVYGYSHTHAPTLYDVATLYTTDNEFVKEMWVAEYGFDSSKIEVHSQPVDIPDAAWKGAQEKNAPLKILWASRLSPEKQPYLISQIANKLGDVVNIDMFGEGDAGFDQTAFMASLPSNVHYLRPFSGFADLPYQKYDLFLYTSLFDGMPNIILEAAGAGMPIVSSAVGGVPTLIHNDREGLLVTELEDSSAYVDQIRLVFDDPQKRLAYAANARKAVQTKHSWHAYKNTIVKFLKSLASSKA